jgi:hypothetical protein
LTTWLLQVAVQAVHLLAVLITGMVVAVLVDTAPPQVHQVVAHLLKVLFH